MANKHTSAPGRFKFSFIFIIVINMEKIVGLLAYDIHIEKYRDFYPQKRKKRKECFP